MEESDNKGVPPYRFNAKELDEETGLYYYGARYLDPTSVGWLSVDPLFEKYVGMSPYGYCAGNPVRLVDVDGRSTHTTEDGTIVAIYADNDLGVYAHPSEDLKEFDYKTKLADGKRLSNTQELKKGETWTMFGFADFYEFEKVKDFDNIPIAIGSQIDWESNWADKAIKDFINDNPSTITYMLNARSGDKYKYDFKRKAPHNSIYYGSQMLGKYASARDLGNFAAGIIKARSCLGDDYIQWGYGTYNYVKNDFFKMIMTMGMDFFMMHNSDPIISNEGWERYNTHKNGEDVFSQQGIDAGFNYWRSNKNGK